jgi:type III pantothenate kinase
MSTFIAITLGNSRAAATLVSDGVIGRVRRAPIENLEELRDVLVRACADCGGEALPIAVASVNPPALERLRQLLADMSLALPEVAGKDFPVPLRTDVREPERMGVDRLLGALAAHRRAAKACIVVDFGTAITVNSVSRDGVFLGGAILPGLGMMAHALAGGTALLPEITVPESAAGIGKNTEEAIAAGILHGATGAVANLVIVAGMTLGEDAAVLLTGGDAERIAAFLPSDCQEVCPDLVLEGLVIAYHERPARHPPAR